MPRKTSTPLPSVGRVLEELGTNIRLARQRRHLTAELLAERAGMTRVTLRAVERGDPRVTLGAVANVLHSLSLEKDLTTVGRADEFGRRLGDSELETQKRVRAPKAGKPRGR